MLDANANDGAGWSDCAERSEADEVTATITSTNPPPRRTPTLAEFMSAVVPWPGSPRDLGHIALINTLKDKKTPTGRNAKGRFVFGNGNCFTDVDKLTSYVNWANGTDFLKDQYFCLSRQRNTKQTKGNNKRTVPDRSSIGAVALKSIWLDVDYGKKDADGNPVGYQTLQETLKAVLGFAVKVGLPPPSAIVSTGGGIHAYWINQIEMTPDVWRPYAEGLKALAVQDGLHADHNVTADAARILRIPGSFNHKEEPPRPCTLLPQPLKLYDFATSLNFLTQITPLGQPHLKPKNETVSLFAEGANLDSFKDAPIFVSADPNDRLSAGIDKFGEQPPLDPRPIFKDCGFYRDALRDGGKNYDQPLWMYSVLGSTFMESGRAFAHEISKGHASYTPDETDAMYDRKLDERERLGLGYPGCAAIAGAGCKACQTCPLLPKGKSPLNIRPAVTATVADASSSSSSSGQANWTRQSGVSFANIPHREWLYGFDLVRGELTVIGSPGGAGKSSLAIGMAICAATDRELLGEKIRGGSNLKALVINGEDSTDEIRRRVYAFCLAHGVAESDLNGLTVVGANDGWVQRISFLTTNEKGMSALNQDGLDALQLALDALDPDLIVLDPLVSFCAGGNMNDNAVMASIMRKLKEIAARYECAMLIVHHTRKGGEAGNVETISGASAITNLARRAIMPAPLTDDDVRRLAVLPSERFQHFKLVDAKSNLAPRATDSPLYRLHSVELPNPEPPLYPNGDNVQAITRVVQPIQSSGAASADEMKIELAIFELVDRV
jgi:AAA domain